MPYSHTETVSGKRGRKKGAHLFAHMELPVEFHEELQPHVDALKTAITLAEEAKASSVKNTAGRRR